jgi:hypothetical protein
MKIVVISNPSSPATSFARAKAFGYITFIYHHADPNHTLSPHKFTYVHTDEELKEKIQLLKYDVTVQEEILRW